MTSLIGQEKRDYQWVFGRDGGTILNFNIEPPAIEQIDKEMDMKSGSSSICDTDGNLLFYSNGCYIANSIHEMMENGDSIGMGYLESSFCENGGSPNTQGVLILPKPTSDSLYYIFYLDLGAPYEFPVGMYFPLAPERLFYSIIDMSLEGGLGKVIEKNQLILQDTFARFGIQATRHSNGTDWWIILPKSHSNCYYKFLFTSDGLQAPDLQCIGNEWGDDDTQGQITFSPKGDIYVRYMYYNDLNIFDFDTSNGQLSNHVNVSFGQDTFNFAGVAFSSSSQFLYATAYTKIYQFDMFADNIEESKYLIGELETPPGTQFKTRFYQARLAPDEKIYISGTNQFNHLHIIHNPNCPESLCGLEQYAIQLNEFPTFNSFTMPNFPHFYDWTDSTVCDTILSTSTIPENFKSIEVFPNPANEFINIKFNESYSGTAKLLIKDLTGTISKDYSLEGLILGNWSKRIEIEDMLSGVYFLTVIHEGKTLLSKKIIIFKE